MCNFSVFKYNELQDWGQASVFVSDTQRDSCVSNRMLVTCTYLKCVQV